MGICLNCNSTLTGEYCSNCGQKELERKDRSLLSFFVHFFNEFFNWDSKFWDSFIPVIVKPGYLTEEYNNGRVQSHISPLKLYLCISLVFFLLARTFDSEIAAELMENEDDFSRYVEMTIKDRGITFEQFSERFDSEALDKLPLYTMLMVFLFSIPVWALFWSHKRFYVEHLVFSLHFYCFVLVSFLLGGLLDKLSEVLIYPFIFLVPVVFLFFALKRVYKEGTIANLVKWGFLSAFYVMLLFIWFLEIFFITIWTI